MNWHHVIRVETLGEPMPSIKIEGHVVMDGKRYQDSKNWREKNQLGCWEIMGGGGGRESSDILMEPARQTVLYRVFNGFKYHITVILFLHWVSFLDVLQNKKITSFLTHRDSSSKRIIVLL